MEGVRGRETRGERDNHRQRETGEETDEGQKCTLTYRSDRQNQRQQMKET